MVILFDQFNLSEDMFEVIFATEQQIQVAQLFMQELRAHGGVLDKTQMSDFANRLHDGLAITQDTHIGPRVVSRPVQLSYNKRQFYDRILTPMKAMGLVDLDLYQKTYKLSDRFTKTMNRVASMWITEAKRS